MKSNIHAWMKSLDKYVPSRRQEGTHPQRTVLPSPNGGGEGASGKGERRAVLKNLSECPAEVNCPI